MSALATWEVVVGLACALGLIAYLLYALLRPEKF